ncbi:SAF domain-containing protein [Microbacterium sp. NPDC076911]|uniref:SAF domain-containing protein n=1 Tax=Microbacterium sp. NPDC076911 TaxID=3154958 RepID=UPI003416D104
MTVADPVRPPRRRAWGDARFLLGVVLIVASIAGVWLVVATARQTAPAFAATRTIVPGQAIAADDLRVVEVALGQLGDSYVAPDELAEGVVATRTIIAGELLPSSAVADPVTLSTTSVVIRTSADVPASIDEGVTVELWAAPLLERGTYDTPRILVADAIVAAITKDESAIGGGSAALELVISRADVAATLAAIADQSALSVVSAGTAS